MLGLINTWEEVQRKQNKVLKNYTRRNNLHNNYKLQFFVNIMLNVESNYNNNGK